VLSTSFWGKFLRNTLAAKAGKSPCLLFADRLNDGKQKVSDAIFQLELVLFPYLPTKHKKTNTYQYQGNTYNEL